MLCAIEVSNEKRRKIIYIEYIYIQQHIHIFLINVADRQKPTMKQPKLLK